MKAIIMSHEKGGSYCIDSNGSFHFVKGYTNVAVGTEIIIRPKRTACLRRLMLIAAGLVVTFIIYGIACGFPLSGQKHRYCPGESGICAYRIEDSLCHSN